MEAVLVPQPLRRALPSLGILLVAAGSLLLGWVGWGYWQPGPAPYRYVRVEAGGIGRFAALGLEAWPDLTIEKYELRADGLDQPIATGHVARRGAAAPVMLDWENRSDDLVHVDTALAEVKALAQAVARHTPPVRNSGSRSAAPRVI